MANSLARTIAAHAKRDPVFRRRVIAELGRQLTYATPNTERWYKISKAIQAFENMK